MFQLLSTSNAAQPPSLDCIASSQLTARFTQASVTFGCAAVAQGHQDIGRIVDIGIKIVANSNTQPEGSTFGRFTAQSPLRRTSRATSQSAQRVIA